MATDTTSPKPTLTLQDELFLFSSLMLGTCFFLPWRAEQAPSDFLSGTGFFSILWWLVLLAIAAAPLTVRFPQVRPWAGLFALFFVEMALVAMGTATEYGAQLTRLFALAMLVLSAKPAVIGVADFAMRRLNAQKAEVSSHWGTALRGVQFSAQEFYTKVEQDIAAREWPGVELLRVLHREAGLLSHSREYLRVVRQRQVFDLCAAHLGKDYFFTLREAEIKPPLSLASLLIFLAALGMLLTWSVNSFGFLPGLIQFFTLLALGLFVLWNTLRMGLTRLDGLLLRCPVLGPVYETFFRNSTTYFQHDTRMVFLKLMDELVKEQVDAETSAKGIKLLSCFEHRPLFDDFYKIRDRPTDGGTK